METQLKPIRVGIAGLGRSGWDIHARTIREMPEQFQIVAVADDLAHRCAEAIAATGCRACSSLEKLFSDDEAEVIVVATPSFLHSEHAIAAMRAGKHVVCEKPMALTTADADRMIAVANETGRMLIPFHNRFPAQWDPKLGIHVT